MTSTVSNNQTCPAFFLTNPVEITAYNISRFPNTFKLSEAMRISINFREYCILIALAELILSVIIKFAVKSAVPFIYLRFKFIICFALMIDKILF